jgi:hypothetical protein
MILTIAILPMVGMFDMGLKTASLGGSYDQARALAQKELAQAQILSYLDLVKESDSAGALPPKPYFPDCSGGALAAFDPSGLSDTTGCTDPDFPGMTYEVKKQFLEPPDSEGKFVASNSNLGVLQINVLVRWGGDHEYEVQTIRTSS